MNRRGGGDLRGLKTLTSKPIDYPVVQRTTMQLLTNLDHIELNGNSLPIVFGDGKQMAGSFIVENLDELRKVYADVGLVLFRNFSKPDTTSLERVSKFLLGKSIEQLGLYTDRKKVSEVVYTATIKHKNDCIPMHSENSYLGEFPKSILFYSKNVAESGGKTPLACLKKVTDSVPDSIKSRVTEHGVMYVRRSGVLPGQDWKSVYPGFAKQGLTEYLQQQNIVVDWEGDALTTHCRLPGLLDHPTTGDELWFNALYSSNSYVVPSVVREYLVREFGEGNLPTDTFYGNGDHLTFEDFSQIKNAYDSNKFSFSWQPADLLWVDNLRYAHGRDSYTGDREMLVIQGNPHHWHL